MQAPFVGSILGMLFHLGAWPIIYATTMWLSLLSGPTMTGIDPTQQKMMRWMPWVFMFVLAQSAVGLVIYWSFSSIFTMVAAVRADATLQGGEPASTPSSRG